MLSSTSSSNERLPALPWPSMLGGALLLATLFVAAMELRLGARGYLATVVDSESLWLEQRERAALLGERALILVGGSRMQLDADLDLLRQRTGLEPVQLAIDGSSFRPVLAGLAADPDVRGTVVVDFSDHLLIQPQDGDAAHRWQKSYERAAGHRALPDFAWSERRLQQALRANLRSYADGAQPLTSLVSRILPSRPTPQYLVMRADRSRLADYTKVDMPGFYYARVLRNIGQEVPIDAGMTWAQLDQALQSRVAAVRPQAAGQAPYERASRELAQQARAIRARGGQVYFAMLPKSGLVRDLDERRYPREMFWDRFAAQAGAPTAHYADVPAWRDLNCPDGSHLDRRQRAAFTAALVEVFGLAR